MSDYKKSDLLKIRLWEKLDKSRTRWIVAKENTLKAREYSIASLEEYRESLKRRAKEKQKLLSTAKAKVKKIKKALKNNGYNDEKYFHNQTLVQAELAEEYAQACAKQLDLHIEITEIAICDAIAAAVNADQWTLDTDPYDH
ncbi:MAG: hypothetical protein AAF717_16985 [Bacteroidota bacterium]